MVSHCTPQGRLQFPQRVIKHSAGIGAVPAWALAGNGIFAEKVFKPSGASTARQCGQIDFG